MILTSTIDLYLICMQPVRMQRKLPHMRMGGTLPQPKKAIPETATDAQKAALKAKQERYKKQQKYGKPDRHPNRIIIRAINKISQNLRLLIIL